MEKNTEKFIFDENPARLDMYLADTTDYTRSKLKKMIDGGRVTVNGVTTKCGQMLKNGDVIEINILPEDNGLEVIVPQDIPLDIIYEDNDLAVINKQQGLVVHPGGGAYTGTLVNAIMFHLSILSGVGDKMRPGIVHRLDKDTSGVMVVAKNDFAHLNLAKQIGAHTAVRTYVGLLEGIVKENDGKIEKNIIRNPLMRKEFKVCGKSEGRTAVTNFRVVSRYRNYTLCEFVLETGRTHQIRVHAKSIGHPVVCDPVYGFKKQRFDHQGQLLHSKSLEFTHPVTNERMKFEAPIPDYFEKILAKISKE